MSEFNVAENRKDLLAALESGEYKQAQGHLRDNGGYCCLGVACDVYRKKTGNGEWENNYSYFRFSDEKETDAWGPTDRVSEFFNLDELVGEENTINLMISMNDSQGYSFKEIAERLRKEGW